MRETKQLDLVQNSEMADTTQYKTYNSAAARKEKLWLALKLRNSAENNDSVERIQTQ